MKTKLLLIIIIIITFIQCKKSLNSKVQYVDSSYFQDFKDTFNFRCISKENDFTLSNLMLAQRVYEVGFYEDTLCFQVVDSYCGRLGYVLYVNVIKDEFEFALLDLSYGQFINTKIIKQSFKIENKPISNNEKIKVEFSCEAVPFDVTNESSYKISGQLELSCFENKNLSNSYLNIDNISIPPENWFK